ncbi:MAG: alpha-ketoglutarate-dependent dioxygenase AlkB [Pseudomonadales bacterium]|nr:alpha-ketoglutarate-dependent dioxygenase AlkB [Pseudomonadales bacterium]HAO55071.1 alpha-ketoglutarate-dependent dioxygenase AlkB [Gammaproteobacteria bacterium]
MAQFEIKQQSSANENGSSISVDSDFQDFSYFPKYLDNSSSDKLLETLLERNQWEREIFKIYGKSISAPRLTSWFSDPMVSYRYSGKKRIGKPFTPELFQLRQILNARLNVHFNFVLANFYRDGKDYVGWHADDEPDLGSRPLIASISLGESRRFRVRHNSRKVTESIDLVHGSLLIMRGQSQSHFKHCLAKTKRLVNSRINLTFRTIQSIV